MKKINKARKITENDLRNLHYIHENEGLIPAGVTRLEDEDITSAEVITENKKSKVNESEDDEYTRKDYKNDLGGYLISLPYEKVKAYKKINDKLTSEEIEELKQKFDKLEHDSVDLDDKLASGEITEEKYYKVRDNLIKKSLKVFRKLTGGCDPDWYDPDLKSKVNEEDIEGRIHDSEIHGNPSTEIGSGNVIIFSIEANYILKKDKEAIFNDALKAYKKLSGISVDSIDDPVFDEGQLYDFIMEVLQDNEHTSKIMSDVKPLIATYYLKYGYGEPYEILCTEADYGIKGFRKVVSTFESDTTYNIDFGVDKKDPNYTKEEANSILRMLGYQADPSQVDLEEIIKHFDIDYEGDSDYEGYITTLLGYYYLMFGRTEFYKDYAHKYGTAIPVNEDDIDDSIKEFRKLTDSNVWKKFKEDWGGTDVYDVAMDAISYVDTLPQMINMLKKVLTEYDMLVDYENGLNALLKQQAVNEGRFEDFMHMNNIDLNIINDKEAFENKIQYFVDQEKSNIDFHEDVLLMLNTYKKKYGETDFYRSLINQGYSLDDLKHEGRLRFFCQKYLKENGFDSNVLNSQYSLKDSIKNMVNNNKDYTQICALLNYYKEHYGMDDFVRSLNDKNNNSPFSDHDGVYYDIDNYGKFETINEYSTRGVYEPNNGEIEDLYYIQAGDIILIHHKDYGELQCKVKKVDANKNKVYFVTIERGIMGVCGFDKIHGIELVDECQKQPMFVQTKHIKFSEGGMCYMCYAKIGDRFVDIYCTFGISLDNCECIKLLNMSEDEFGIIDHIMAESDTMDDAKQRVYNSGLISL